jgi:hypothetical protein
MITRPLPPGIVDIGPSVSFFDAASATRAEMPTSSLEAARASAAGMRELTRTASGRKTLLQTEWLKYLKFGENNDNVFLVHVCETSAETSQKYDVTIFLMRHVWRGENQKRDFLDIERAYFYFGPSWRDEVFEVDNHGDYIGVRISAWGMFLATCLVIFKSKRPLILERYIDFAMEGGVLF